jgi:predicted DNA-binding protein (MmcQ/YjbR family)
MNCPRLPSGGLDIMTPATLEQLCMKFPGTTQDIKWGNDLCYLVGKKMYCVTGVNPPLTVLFKVLPEEFVELTDREGVVPAPYMARNHWVLVEIPGALSEKEWRHYIRQSYELVFSGLTKKLQQQIR